MRPVSESRQGLRGREGTSLRWRAIREWGFGGFGFVKGYAGYKQPRRRLPAQRCLYTVRVKWTELPNWASDARLRFPLGKATNLLTSIHGSSPL